MDTKQQDELDTKQKESEGKKNSLLEIYKLHAQLAMDISNLKATVYRFYPTLISGLLVILLTLLRYKDDVLPGKIEGDPYTGYSVLVTGFLGNMLSLIWIYYIKHYNRILTLKYKVLMELETKLEFQFFEEERKLTAEKVHPIPSISFSKAETYIPRFFLFLFILLTIIGFFLSSGRVKYLLKSIFN